MSTTEALARFAASTRYQDIPADVIQLAKRLILDTFGNAAAGFATTGAKLALRTAAEWGGTPESTVLVTGLRTSAPLAAFSNVSLASALEADDTLLNIGHHAHVSLFPALAIAERVGASGADLLKSFVLAYELGGRIASAGHSVIRKPDGKLKFSETGVGVNWVTFPAVIGAGVQLGFDTNTMASALGLAGVSSSIPTGRRWNRPGWCHMKYNAYAFMAQGGVQAALLAHNGFTGDPDIFDGEANQVKANWWQMSGSVAYSPEAATGGLGERWLMRGAAFKPYPSCRFTHGALAGFRKIMDEGGLTPGEIEAVDIYTGRTMFVFKMDRPEVMGEEDAQFSMPHLIAMVALGVRRGPEWVAERYWDDPAVESIKAKVTCHADDDANGVLVEQLVANNFEKFPYRIKVKARGRLFEASGDYAPGDPFASETMFGDKEVIGKVRDFAEPILGASKLDDLIEAIMNLERAPRLSTLFGRLVQARTGST